MSLTSDDIYDEFHLWQRDKFLPELNRRFSHKANTQSTMNEIEKYAVDECHKRGYIVRVHTSECLLGLGPIVIDLVDTTPDHDDRKHGVDREKREWETRKSVERNEEAELRKYLNELNSKS